MGTTNHVANDASDTKKHELDIILPKRDKEEGKILKQQFLLTEDTTCGIGIFKGSCLQKFANKKAYVILYGLLGCVFSASYAYFNGTITTLEKRFKIPSRTTGTLTAVNKIEREMYPSSKNNFS